WIALLACAALAAVVYLNSLGGAFVYDDRLEIRDNPDLRRLSFALESFTSRPWEASRGYGFTYRPLSWSFATLLHRAGAGVPLPFHAFNVFLHALDTLLLGLLIERLLAAAGAVPDRERRWIAAGAAALFAVHPVHAEAVA